MKINFRYKLFFVWFSLMLPAIILALFAEVIFFQKLSWLLLLFMGLIIAVDTALDAFNSVCSVRWPSTTFKIVNYRIVATTSNNEQGGISYNTYFEIEYSVNGKAYRPESHELNVGQYSTEEAAQNHVKSVLSFKNENIIYYNEVKPYMAFIKPGLKFRHCIGVGIGLALMSISSLSLFGLIVWK
jgi:hypothetical protein